MKQALYLSAMSVICPLGATHTDVFSHLITGDISGMRLSDKYSTAPFILGELTTSLPPTSLRCNQILAHLYMQLEPLIEQLKFRYGKKRIGVVLGSSNGGMNESYENMQKVRSNDGSYDLYTLEIGSPSNFLLMHANISGPGYTISTACSSSAKAFASAKNLIEAGLCDAVIAGGVDSLCDFTVNGFNALEAMSKSNTNPFSRNRNGINIGEGGALFLVTTEDITGNGIKLLGIGESSDAYHITSPEPSGIGAKQAMLAALNSAGITPDAINYINLHGTGTMANDSMESYAVSNVFSNIPFCSSTKPMTGHALGACGAIEMAFCWLLLSPLNQNYLLPPHIWDEVADANIPALNFVKKGDKVPKLYYCMSNSFAFGGSNISLVVGR